MRPTLALLPLCAAALLLLLATGAAGAVTVTADAAGSARRPFDALKLTKCFGSGHATLALRDDWRRQLLQVKRDLGLQHVRFHGLLDDDMSAVIGDAAPGVYSFANVLNVFDFLVANGVAPIVELSFMPELYASGNDTIFHYKGNITPPKRWADWYNLVAALADVLIERYGPAELGGWRFEVWNEPNCGFWTGTKDQYFELYNTTARALRSRATYLQVGGPATCQVAWLPEMADYAKKNNLPLDFLSTHLYPTDPNVPQNRTGFEQVIDDAQRFAASAGVPLVMTEFNCGLGIDCADAPYAAGFVVHVAQAIQSMLNLDTLSYWTFTDVFEEGGHVSVPFSQAFGIQTYQGVPKPVYRALQLVTALYPAAVDALVPANGTIDAIVTTSATGVRALVANWNYYHQPIATETVQLVVTCPAGKKPPATAQVVVIDDAHANPAATWVQQGRPTYPTAAQVAEQLAASQLAPSSLAPQVGANGTVTFTFTALPQSVTSLTWEWL